MTSAFDTAWRAEVFEDFSDTDKQFLDKVIAWVEPYIADKVLFTQELAVHHVKGTLKVLSLLEMDVATMAAALISTITLTQEGSHLLEDSQFTTKILDEFGTEIFDLVEGAQALIRIGTVASQATLATEEQEKLQQEMLRKMLLAMATDLRIVLIRLAARLQTLRWYAESKLPCPPEIALQTSNIYAPLANRLGIWQIKWEMEDLSLRFLKPEIYREIAQKLEAKRTEREDLVNNFIAKLRQSLEEQHIKADVAGRAKHIYSIYNKMRNKSLAFEELYDLLAIRIIVKTERDCYTALSLVHSYWTPVMEEFDDYIARPKPNGYRSLHTVVKDDKGHIFEVQIRTHQMHQFAEYGMAAHWRYKEAGKQGGKVSASSLYDRQISWMRQLLSWRKEVGITEQAEKNQTASQADIARKKTALEKEKEQLIKTKPTQDKPDRIYVMTPQARLLELPAGSTPVDFAYLLHTDLGHRCRGAKVDGQLVALNTPLKTGQTVEIIAAKSGGPSRDWLNPQLGYLHSPRAKAKVRLWFNAIELQLRINHGQELVEKELQRLGKTSVNLEHLASKLGFAHPDDLYVAVAKDEFSLRQIAQAFIEVEPSTTEEKTLFSPRQSAATSATTTGKSGVLVVGVDSLMTQLARCCHPAPPDAIGGFVTRGRGVSIHRINCPSFKVMQQKDPDRIIEVDWGNTNETVYPVNIKVVSMDRNGLLRDISEVFAKMKLNVIGVHTQTKESNAYLNFTVEISNGTQLNKALKTISDVSGVISAHRV
ncbi:bifunctional (p)ppGpp synthetase/guanosine-3',5'-bis(diphosphate) 3'-pyrophosphohydrolase [Pelistega sp. NLN82]|uniref:GTP pyrophosphokinase n=1 Tax=Pelistega ratti TaxID=2652177 RepID=A0A6L9Y7D5_9BURK|nr:bifunctional (p)ppGpp synthetase/guanosine-3',5'-bis(diphosphate) 3'-pyrophosphohydrolase [Pelistega ratti]NEN76299.1 bifunctional (p)ppGpp synthetase/guanosine-3',5'-bis(diphosphate) 3'-pyrophosphohydrolase [Pelistega ratti]